MERKEDATSTLQNLETYEVIVMHLRSTWIEGVNWEYIRRSKDVLKFSWTSYVGTTYFLYPVGVHPVLLNESIIFIICQGHLKILSTLSISRK